MKKLAKLYPASKQTPIAFDPLQECAALPAMRRKKSSQFFVEVFVLTLLVLPRGKDLILARGKNYRI